MGERSDECYLARPEGSARALVGVLHSWWGLTGCFMGRCDDLAAHGYLAVAPDLYRGAVATTVDEADRLRHRRRSGSDWRRIVAALTAARGGRAELPVALVGYSMGGHWALWLAKQDRPEIPMVAATVVYYATRGGDFAASRSVFQVHLAEHDPYVSAAGVSGLGRDLRRAGRPVEIHRYPGTGHWFAEADQAGCYDESAADLAWRRTLAAIDAATARWAASR